MCSKAAAKIRRPASQACWAIVQPATGHVIGTSFLHSHHARHHRAEIAFNLAQHTWGHGYATEVAHAVIQAGYTHYGLKRIEGTCMLGNVASARVMEKVGMRCEGILHQYVFAKNAFHDMRLYAILHEERRRVAEFVVGRAAEQTPGPRLKPGVWQKI